MTAITVTLATDRGATVGQTSVEPVCGVDFCDHCGCCIACYNGCCPLGCRVVVYEDGLAEWLEGHDLSTDPFQLEERKT